MHGLLHAVGQQVVDAAGSCLPTPLGSRKSGPVFAAPPLATPIHDATPFEAKLEARLKATLNYAELERLRERSNAASAQFHKSMSRLKPPQTLAEMAQNASASKQCALLANSALKASEARQASEAAARSAWRAKLEEERQRDADDITELNARWREFESEVEQVLAPRAPPANPAPQVQKPDITPAPPQPPNPTPVLSASACSPAPRTSNRGRLSSPALRVPVAQHVSVTTTTTAAAQTPSVRSTKPTGTAGKPPAPRRR